MESKWYLLGGSSASQAAAKYNYIYLAFYQFDKNPSDTFVIELVGYYKFYKFKIAESCTNSYVREIFVTLAHKCNERKIYICKSTQIL